MAVAADIDEGVGEALHVEIVEDGFEGAMVAEPAVDDRDLDGPVADLLVIDHRFPVYCFRKPAAVRIDVHFAMSARMKSANAAGPPPSRSLPCAFNAACTGSPPPHPVAAARPAPAR